MHDHKFFCQTLVNDINKMVGTNSFTIISIFTHSLEQASSSHWVSKTAPQPRDLNDLVVCRSDRVRYSRRLTPFQLNIKWCHHHRFEWKSLVSQVKCDKCLSQEASLYIPNTNVHLSFTTLVACCSTLTRDNISYFVIFFLLSQAATGEQI